MKFKQEPDYDFLLQLFKCCLKSNGIDTKKPDFCWNKLTAKKVPEKFSKKKILADLREQAKTPIRENKSPLKKMKN